MCSGKDGLVRKPDAMANLMRRTLMVTSAPILKQLAADGAAGGIGSSVACKSDAT